MDEGIVGHDGLELRGAVEGRVAEPPADVVDVVGRAGEYVGDDVLDGDGPRADGVRQAPERVPEGPGLEARRRRLRARVVVAVAAARRLLAVVGRQGAEQGVDGQARVVGRLEPVCETTSGTPRPARTSNLSSSVNDFRTNRFLSANSFQAVYVETVQIHAH